MSKPNPNTHRGAELLLTIWAVAIGLGGYISVSLATVGSLPPGAILFTFVLLAFAGSAHFMVRRLAPYADPVLLPLVVVLNALGLVMIHRIDIARDTTLANNQFAWTILGIVAFIAVLHFVRDHRALQAMTYTFGVLGLLLLMLPLIPGLGVEIYGARIWIGIGPFSFQPGEMAKIALAIFFAGYLVQTRDALTLAGRRVLGIDLPRARDLGPILVAWGASMAVLVLQRDLGSSLLLFGLFVVMLYIATERVSWLILGGVMFAGGAYVAYLLFGHVQRRVDAWLDPFSDPDANYQLISALYGMAHGGIFGRGLGQGAPYLTPVSYSDFIATSFAEELGLAGFMAILLIYALIVERGFRIALTCRDNFGKLLAAGLAASIGLQVFVVVGGVTGLIPSTGLTTPFMSHGGSSILANWMIIALLLRISDRNRRPDPEVQAFDRDEPTQVVRAV